MSSKFERDVERDARLTFANMRGVSVPAYMREGFTPQQMHDHTKWLRKQGEVYIDKVVQATMQLEIKKPAAPPDQRKKEWLNKGTKNG